MRSVSAGTKLNDSWIIMMPNCTVPMPMAATSGTNIGVSSSTAARQHGSRQVDEHAYRQHDEVDRKNDHAFLTQRVLNEGYE